MRSVYPPVLFRKIFPQKLFVLPKFSQGKFLQPNAAGYLSAGIQHAGNSMLQCFVRAKRLIRRRLQLTAKCKHL
jgi:hypothetical protein